MRKLEGQRLLVIANISGEDAIVGLGDGAALLGGDVVLAAGARDGSDRGAGGPGGVARRPDRPHPRGSRGQGPNPRRRSPHGQPHILCLCHGGAIANPEDAQYILDHTDGITGFYGASSIERFPTEVGIRRQTEDFKAITFKK
ncbi:MAG: phosphoenolpyruvate hydrolase family protein [Actinomycetota bacterium]